MSTWQYPSGVAVVAVARSSGMFATIAQLSVLVRPVLTPPWKREPLREPRVDAEVDAVPVLDLLAVVGREGHEVARPAR